MPTLEQETIRVCAWGVKLNLGMIADPNAETDDYADQLRGYAKTAWTLAYASPEYTPSFREGILRLGKRGFSPAVVK